MAIFDLFNVSFLFSIGIIIILIGGIFTYVSYRMSEQDHKLSSMVNLVSILAQDLQHIKLLQRAENSHGLSNTLKDNNIQYASDIMVDNLNENVINVSDGESDGESDSEYEDDDVEDDDVEDDDVEDDDVEDEDDVEEIDIEDAPKINVLKLNSVNSVNIDVDNLEELDNQAEELDTQAEELDNQAEELDNQAEELDNQAEELDNQAEDLVELPKENMSFLKNIDVIDIGEVDSKSDYKKMSINKLREVVVSKGLIADASKLKKQDILKLLGDE